MRYLDPKDVKFIVVHCTATPEGMELTVDQIDAMHRRRGFSMIGYHYVVHLDGSISVGRPDDRTGAHVKGYNRKSVGLTYVGGLDQSRKPKDTRTDMQSIAIVNKLEELKLKFPNAKVLGHRDLSPDLDGDGVVEKHEWLKQCPCYDVMDEYPWLNE